MTFLHGWQYRFAIVTEVTREPRQRNLPGLFRIQPLEIPMDRSERRHHTRRIKAKFYRLRSWYEWWSPNEAEAGRFANHGKGCSCWMCGNPRKYFGELTLQEKRANQDKAQP